MALVAAYTGTVDEDKILNMSYDWFSDILDVLGERINFEAVSNYAGNSFVEKSWDMIMDANPMTKGVIETSHQRQMAAFFNDPRTIVLAPPSEGADGNGESNVPIWQRITCVEPDQV